MVVDVHVDSLASGLDLVVGGQSCAAAVEGPPEVAPGAYTQWLLFSFHSLSLPETGFLASGQLKVLLRLLRGLVHCGYCFLFILFLYLGQDF